MSIYALIELTPNPDNAFPVVNIEDRTSSPPVVNGFRWIRDDDWAEGQLAGVGKLWDGQIPASFSDPVPVSGDPQTAEEAYALIQQRTNELIFAHEALARIQSL